MDSSIRVLHVEDDPGFGDLVAEFLEQTDDQLDVTSARNAEEGLDRLQADPEEFDCVVSDYDMPEQNGIEFLEEVRTAFPELPFVLFTGKGSEEVASEAISAGATDYLQKDSGTEQYGILANRIGNAVEQYRSTHRAENLERLRTLSAEVNHELVRAETREAVETAVCETISGTEPYRFAWIGSAEPDSAGIVPRTMAGDDDGYLEAVSIPSGEDDAPMGPAAKAVQERRVVASQDVEHDPTFEPWREAALARGFRSVAAAPLVYDDHHYGVLVVYASRTDVFDDAEQELLAELAADVAHAVHARQVRSDLEEFRALLDSADDAIHMLDPESGQFLEFNERARQRLGYDREALLNRSVVDVEQAIDDLAAFREVVDRIRDEGSVLMEGVHEAADGSTFPVEVQADYVTVNDRDYVVVIARDITEKRQRRLQRQRDALLELTTDPTVTDGDFESAVERITETAASVLDVPRVNVWLFEEDETTLRCVDNFDESSGTHDRGATLHTEAFPEYFEALRTNRTIEAASARRDPRTSELTDDYLRPNDVEALLDATLRSEGEVAGVVCVENVGSTREWTEDEVEFVSDIADIVDRAHRNQRTRQRERELELRERAIDEAPVGITITDYQRPDNPITYVNASSARSPAMSATRSSGRTIGSSRAPARARRQSTRCDAR
ncbi:GAF domain-containing protein [Haloparvum sp. PAK95]|uniref:GAF domain-containing protein n=1 Tax=Haloparvum sp. PAK95 TaxID=3418962 RepID=UPI003D2EC348